MSGKGQAVRKHLIVVVAAVAGIVPVASAHASEEHSCRQGDPPIQASPRTSCSFAGTIVTDYVDVCHQARTCHMSVSSSPARRARDRIACRRFGARYTGVVLCTGPAGTGVWARFSSDI